MENKNSPKIDAVIAWVDGSDPALIKRQQKYLKSELNNPARGYTKGGIARGGGAAIKGTDFKGVF